MYRLPLIGEQVLISDLVSLPLAIVAVVWWAVERNGQFAWICQDLFGISLILLVLRVLRVQSLKVASILLSLAFLYDVFWVFISPKFFGSSVMVAVAQGGSAGEALPMLLKAPAFGLPYEFAAYSMLGYGDVILPGLLVSFLRRCQVQAADPSSRSHISYFFLSSVAYCVGLMLTWTALEFSWFGDQGQPALLYLVPCTLGSTWAYAWWRGELTNLWRGLDEDEESEASKASSEKVEALI